MSGPDISIVVCTQNRAALLRGALESLSNLATDDLFSYEVVVVDNASSDDTPAVVAAAARRCRRCRIRAAQEQARNNSQGAE